MDPRGSERDGPAVDHSGVESLSILVPVYNEEENLPKVYGRLREVLDELGHPYEIIFVNDGSTDQSGAVLTEIALGAPAVKVIHFRRNFGQTAAMMAGLDHASGDILIPIDADLQNDPADIPLLLEKLAEGYDVVSGWRRDRKDSFHRVLPSRIANKLISTISGVKLHDYGCSLKAYRRSCLTDVKLYGEMHRFIPIYASWTGGKVTEVPVNHHPRVHGASKYGMERIVKVVLDLIVVQFLAKYETKPIYIFGGFGLSSILVSFCSGIFALYLKFFEDVSFIQTPLPLLVVMTFITGVMSVLMGLLAEIIMRVYYESQGKTPYLIRATSNLERGD